MQITEAEILKHIGTLHNGVGLIAGKQELGDTAKHAMSESAFLLLAGALNDLNRIANYLEEANAIARRVNGISVAPAKGDL